MSAMVYWSAASHSWSFRRSSSTCMREGTQEADLKVPGSQTSQGAL